MSQFFGFELLLNSVRADLKEKHELIAVVFHWFLIRENFQCIGTGTERELLESDIASELMPVGWNENTQTYYLRYFNPELKKILVLDLTMASPQEAVVTIAGDEEVTKGYSMNVDDYLADFNLATNTKTKIQHIMPRIDELMYKFQTLYRQLIPTAGVSTSAATPATTPAPEPTPTSPPNVLSTTSPPLRNRANPDILRDPMAMFRDVGRGDLDPFHVGGGMLGVGPQRLPHARYDPVGPIPDRDHFRPPGRPGFMEDDDDILNINPHPRRGQGRFPPPGPGGSGPDWYS